MDRQPALFGLLIAILVLARFMQDGDADVAIFGHWQKTRIQRSLIRLY